MRIEIGDNLCIAITIVSMFTFMTVVTVFMMMEDNGWFKKGKKDENDRTNSGRK